MAFTYITGTSSTANDALDALAANWEFDSVDTESTNHSVTWGNIKIETSSASIYFYLNNSQLNYYGSAYGAYKIIKTNNALLMICNNRFCLYIDTATSCISGEQIKCGGLLGISDTDTHIAFSTDQREALNAQFSANPDAVLMTNIMGLSNGYVCDNALQVLQASTNSLNGEYSLGGNNHYIVRWIALKDE